MKTKKSPRISISVSLPEPVRDAARQAAFDDNRPLSGLINLLLEDYLAREGYLRDHSRRRVGVAEPSAARYGNRQPKSTTH